eukprot:Nk52_evm3s168 gene=Nk52_evmTU3s168
MSSSLTFSKHSAVIANDGAEDIAEELKQHNRMSQYSNMSGDPGAVTSGVGAMNLEDLNGAPAEENMGALPSSSSPTALRVAADMARKRTSSHTEQLETFGEILIDNVKEGLRAVEENEELVEQGKASGEGEEVEEEEKEEQAAQAEKKSKVMFSSSEEKISVYESCLESLMARCLFFDQQTFSRGNVSSLVDYLDSMFGIDAAQRRESIDKLCHGRERSSIGSGRCYGTPKVQVNIVKARNLAAKDRSGKSDPYCGISVLQGVAPKDLEEYAHQTKVVEQNLNPVWNETFQFDLQTGASKKNYVLIDVFDFDETSTARRAMEKVAKFNPLLKDLGKGSHDFLGRVEINLADIDPFNPYPTWHKLQQRSSKSHVEGDILVNITSIPNCVVNEFEELGVSKLDLAHEYRLFHYALLEYEAKKLYVQKYDDATGMRLGWDGAKSHEGGLVQGYCDEVFGTLGVFCLASIHLNNFVRLAGVTDVDDTIMSVKLGEVLEAANAQSQREEFENVMLKESLTSVYEGCEARLNNFTSNFRAVNKHKLDRMSACLKMVRDIAYHPLFSQIFPEKGFPEMSCIVDGFVQSTLSKSLKRFQKEADGLVAEEGVSESYLEAEKATLMINNITNQLLNIKNKYQAVVNDAVDIDIFASSCEFFCKGISENSQKIISKISQGLKEDSDSLDRRISGFYYALMNLQRDVLDEVDEEFGLDIYPALTDYGPIIVQWMQLISKKNVEWVNNALMQDKVTAMDGNIKCSTSVVDIFFGFNSTVSLLEKIDFPDDNMNSVFCTLLAEMICRGCELYTNQMHKKVYQAGFYDDEGQFDVTEELCISLNNIEQARVRLAKLKTSILDVLGDATETGALNVIEELFKESEKYLGDHLDSLLAATVEKMEPDLIRYLNHMTGTADALIGDGIQAPQEKPKFSLFGKRKSSMGIVTGGSLANEDTPQAVEPILQYLNSNLETLSEYIYVDIFKCALSEIWRVILNIMLRMTAPNKSSVPANERGIQVFTLSEKEDFDKLDSAMDMLGDYFEAGGDGLTPKEVFCGGYVQLKDIFDLCKAETSVLIRKYCAMEEEVEELTEKDYGLGSIAIALDYRTFGEKVGGGVLNIDIVSGKDLKAMDSNGLSDPYVVCEVFPELVNSQMKTKTQKKTLSPFFNEHFSIDFPKDVDIKDYTLTFTVWDHDFFSQDDFMGEVFVSLGEHFSSGTSYRVPGTLDIKLQHPSGALHTSGERQEIIYGVLQRRECDMKAKEFIKKRLQAVNASVSSLKQ